MIYCLLFLMTMLSEEPVNKNQVVIDRELKNIDSYVTKYDFVDGEIYLVEDTLKSEILHFRGKRKKNDYLFCIARLPNDSIKAFTARDIKGYRMNNMSYYSHEINDIHFFIKKVESGKIDLYQKIELPADGTFLYYFTKDQEVWYRINPNSPSTKSPTLPENNPFLLGAGTSYVDLGINMQFEMFFTQYTADCPKVKNSIKNGFYTISNIPLVVNTYNECF